MDTAPQGALGGLRVLDLTDDIGGQYCARLLADYGADVTLVEPPGGSSLRRAAPIAGESLLFFHLNHGKRSVLLDPATEAGRAVMHRLISRADVVIAGPSLDRATCAAANPNCIAGVISPFGPSGRWATWRGSELIYQALAGVMMHNGEPGASRSMDAATGPRSRPAPRSISACWPRCWPGRVAPRARPSTSASPRPPPP